MTKPEKRDALAKEYSTNKYPIHPLTNNGFTQDINFARRMSHCQAFQDGFDASTAYHAEIIGELVKALEFYAEFEISYKWEGIISPGTPFSKFIDIGKTEFISPARQALESVRGKI